jgi:RHS repeat-associated protein
MLEPGLQYPAGNPATYRYGFNGKEQDNEVKGVGNWIDYGMRTYDPRIGRFPSLDPLTAKYPWYSPYQYAGNKPVWKKDIDGLEENEEEGKNEEREELEKDREKEEFQAKIRNALKSPTAEEEAKRQRELDEILKKSPEERGRQGAAALGRLGLANSFRNYINNGVEAAKIVLSPPDAQFVETFVKNAPGVNYGIAKFDGPLST